MSEFPEFVGKKVKQVKECDSSKVDPSVSNCMKETNDFLRTDRKRKRKIFFGGQKRRIKRPNVNNEERKIDERDSKELFISRPCDSGSNKSNVINSERSKCSGGSDCGTKQRSKRASKPIHKSRSISRKTLKGERKILTDRNNKSAEEVSENKVFLEVQVKKDESKPKDRKIKKDQIKKRETNDEEKKLMNNKSMRGKSKVKNYNKGKLIKDIQSSKDVLPTSVMCNSELFLSKTPYESVTKTFEPLNADKLFKYLNPDSPKPKVPSAEQMVLRKTENENMETFMKELMNPKSDE